MRRRKKRILFAIQIGMIAGLASWSIVSMRASQKPKTVKANKAQIEALPSYQTAIVPYELTEEELKEERFYDSLETLAICVEAEAGNQDLMGKRLVADVILNRVDSDRFPNDIESVIYQGRQFSTSFDGGMDHIYEPSEETFKAVRMELEHRTDKNILFFTAGAFNPYCRPAYKYGAHYFGY